MRSGPTFFLQAGRKLDQRAALCREWALPALAGPAVFTRILLETAPNSEYT